MSSTTLHEIAFKSIHKHNLQEEIHNLAQIKHYLLLQNNVVGIFCLVEIFSFDQAWLRRRRERRKHI